MPRLEHRGLDLHFHQRRLVGQGGAAQSARRSRQRLTHAQGQGAASAWHRASCWRGGPPGGRAGRRCQAYGTSRQAGRTTGPAGAISCAAAIALAPIARWSSTRLSARSQAWYRRPSHSHRGRSVGGDCPRWRAPTAARPRRGGLSGGCTGRRPVRPGRTGPRQHARQAMLVVTLGPSTRRQSPQHTRTSRRRGLQRVKPGAQAAVAGVLGGRPARRRPWPRCGSRRHASPAPDASEDLWTPTPPPTPPRCGRCGARPGRRRPGAGACGARPRRCPGAGAGASRPRQRCPGAGAGATRPGLSPVPVRRVSTSWR